MEGEAELFERPMHAISGDMIAALGWCILAMVASTGPDTLRPDVDGDGIGTLRSKYTTVNAKDALRTIFVSWRTEDRAPRGTSQRIRALRLVDGELTTMSEDS